MNRIPYYFTYHSLNRSSSNNNDISEFHEQNEAPIFDIYRTELSAVALHCYAILSIDLIETHQSNVPSLFNKSTHSSYATCQMSNVEDYKPPKSRHRSK